MERPILLSALAVVLTGLLLSGLDDSSSPVVDSGSPDTEVASTLGEGNDSDLSNATITITWRTAPLPDR